MMFFYFDLSYNKAVKKLGTRANFFSQRVVIILNELQSEVKLSELVWESYIKLVKIFKRHYILYIFLYLERLELTTTRVSLRSK